MTFIFLRHLNFTNILKDINTNIVSLHNIEGVTGHIVSQW